MSSLRTAWEAFAGFAGFAHDPFRSLVNESGADYDRAAYLIISWPMFLLLLIKHAWKDGQPVLALRLTTWPLAAQCLAVLISRSRSTYVRRRELFCSACQVVAVLNTMQGSLAMASSVIEWHGGSPLRLLASMAVWNATLAVATGALYFRLVLSWCRVSLPLIMLVPLWFGRPLCRRLLEAPDMRQPLAELYSLLGAIHTAALHESTAVTWRLQGPMEECLVLNSWMLLAAGVAMPLVVLFHLERQARARFEGRHQQEQEQEQQDPDELEPQALRWPQAPASGYLGPSLTLYLLSCIIWTVATTVQDAKRTWGAPPLPNDTTQIA